MTLPDADTGKPARRQPGPRDPSECSEAGETTWTSRASTNTTLQEPTPQDPEKATRYWSRRMFTDHRRSSVLVLESKRKVLRAPTTENPGTVREASRVPG